MTRTCTAQVMLAGPPSPVSRGAGPSRGKGHLVGRDISLPFRWKCDGKGLPGPPGPPAPGPRSLEPPSPVLPRLGKTLRAEDGLPVGFASLRASAPSPTRSG